MTDLTDHYEKGGAASYLQHHNKSWRNRISTYRECQLLKKAWRRAGQPDHILDLPCGTGRFWTVFSDDELKSIVGADSSEEMLVVAEKSKPEGIDLETVRTDVLETSFEDKKFPFTACMRFFHHLSRPEDRRQAYAELTRITQNYLVISLWTDGNLGSFRRRNRAVPVAKAGYGKRIFRPRQEIEAEIEAMGLSIVFSEAVWPGLAMWRYYLLKINNNG